MTKITTDEIEGLQRMRQFAARVLTCKKYDRANRNTRFAGGGAKMLQVEYNALDLAAIEHWLPLATSALTKLEDAA